MTTQAQSPGVEEAGIGTSHPESDAAGRLDTDLTAGSRLIVGLGNPGDDYANTRHNVGFLVVDELARRRQLLLDTEECRSLVAEAEDVLLVEPQTYMNRSGYAVRCLAERRSIEPAACLIVYDDVHLPLGALRMRPKGSPGGQKGMESVLESLGTDRVPRLRFGIGSGSGSAAEPVDGKGLSDFVLAPFGDEERQQIPRLIERAANACELWLSDGIAAAMQRYNGPPPEQISESTM